MVTHRARVGPVRTVARRKGNRVRFLTLLDPVTDARFTSLVAAASPQIEARLGTSVIANRVERASARPPALELEPTGRARSRFIHLATELCRAPFVLVADVEDFYPSVTPAVLAEALDRAHVASATATAIADTLGDLSSAGVRGLPIGPPASAVLANAVLSSVDDALDGADACHLRWVDDVWAPARSRSAAEDLLGTLERSLHALGLRLSPRKTRIAASVEVTPARLSPVGGQYHRPPDAHPLPGLARADALVPGRG